MKPFYPAIFTTLYGVFSFDATAVAGGPIPDGIKESMREGLPKHRRFCAELGFIASIATIDSVLVLVSKADSTWGEFHELAKAFRRELDAELFGRLFFSLHTSEVDYYSNPTKDWEQVIETWPKTQIDIEESSRCYACSRYAAAIFHVLLVAELGVIEVATLLGVAGDKPGWGSLDRLERILRKQYKERSPIERIHYELLKQVVPLMLAMKDSWRHKISHVENRLEWLDTDFSPQLAEEIITAVRGFMRRLATELAPKPVPC